MTSRVRQDRARPEPMAEILHAPVLRDGGLEQELETRRVERLLHYWRSLRPLEGVPVFFDFDPNRNPVPWKQCFLLARGEDDSFMFDHFGTGLFALVWTFPAVPAEVPAGTVVGELVDGVAAVVAQGQPWQVAGESAGRDGTIRHRSILLPFRDAQWRLAYVLGAVTYCLDKA